MSTPEQPANPPLTRKKMREIRNTGSTPIITDVPAIDAEGGEATSRPPAVVSADVTPESGSVDAEQAAEDESHLAVDADTTSNEVPEAATPKKSSLPRAATPVDVSPPPVADSSVDLGVTPLTRRQARQQERIRTASVPVITPDIARGEQEHEPAAVESEPGSGDAGAASGEDTAADAGGFRALFGTGETPVAEPRFSVEDFSPVADDVVSAENEGWRDVVLEATPETAALAAGLVAQEAREESITRPAERDVARTASAEDEAPRAVVNPQLGASLLTAERPSEDLPASFDQIFSRSTGAVSTSNALIISDAPPVSDFGGAVTSTGEIIVTGTIQLPEGLGSTGHARGTTDGKEIDAVLIDGELPAHSSPTPIAASAAISTVKTAGEVIKPPVPEKGSRLMMSLAITAGVLALALVGVLIVAFATGVFS